MIRKRIINVVSIEKIIRAFANLKRLDILELLKGSPDLSVADISERLRVDYKLTSSHISKLSIAGLVSKKHRGPAVLHKLTKRGDVILMFVRTLE